MRNPDDTTTDPSKAYLLRIWMESQPGADGRLPEWRFSLQDTLSGARCGFTSLQALVDYLDELLSGNPDND
jgi:hypothetical protein